jgi:hypothetical protein
MLLYVSRSKQQSSLTELFLYASWGCLLRSTNRVFQCTSLTLVFKGRAMAQTDTGLSPRWPGWVFSSREICGGQSWDWDRFFPPNTSVFPCLYHSISVPCLSSSTRCSYQKDKREKPGNRPKSRTLRKSGSIE